MRIRSAAAPLAVVFVLLAGCGDGTGPVDAVRVAMTVEMSEPHLLHHPDRIECSATYRALALGPRGGIVTWQDAVLRWYTGAQRSQPAEVMPVDAEDVRELWRRAELGSGESVTGEWILSADVPFVVETEFRYTTTRTRELQSVRVISGCAVDTVPPAALPAVRDLVLATPSPLQPGDTFTVSFTASAATGLWDTRIRITGAYQHELITSERLVGEARRTVQLIVPPGAMLGTAFEVQVDATDVYGQRSAAATAGSSPLVDLTPPRLNDVHVTSVLGPGTQRGLVGQFAVGDTMALQVSAWDNSALAELTIDVGADRHRFPLAGSWVFDTFRLEVRPSWPERPGLTIRLTDALGLAAPPLSAHADSIRVHPVATYASAFTHVSGRLLDAAWDAGRERLHALLETEPAVLVVSTASLAVERRVALPARGAGLDVAADGDVLVTLPVREAVAIIEPATGALREIDLAGAQLGQLDAIRALAGGRAVVTGVTHNGTPRIALLDLATGDVLWTALLTGSGRPRLARNPDGTVLGILSGGCLQVWSAAGGGPGACKAIAHYDGGLSADASGGRFVVAGNVIDVATGATRQPSWGLPPMSVSVNAFSADGESILLPTMRGLLRIRIDDGVVLERIPMPMVYGMVLPSADGTRLLAVSRDMDTWPDRFRIDRVLLR